MLTNRLLAALQFTQSQRWDEREVLDCLRILLTMAGEGNRESLLSALRKLLREDEQQHGRSAVHEGDHFRMLVDQHGVALAAVNEVYAEFKLAAVNRISGDALLEVAEKLASAILAEKEAYAAWCQATKL